MEKPIAAEVDRQRVAGAQRHGAKLRGDHALIAHVIGQECHIAATGGIDRAFVDDAPRAVAGETSGIAAQARVTHIERGGNQAAHVDLCVLAKNDAVRVDQVHLPIGVQAPENPAAVGAQNAVDRNGGCRRLQKIDRCLRPNAEAQPIDRDIHARLPNIGDVAGLGDAGAARRDLPTEGMGRGVNRDDAARGRHARRCCG